MLEIRIKIGNLILHMESYRDLAVDAGLANFLVDVDISGFRYIRVRILPMESDRQGEWTFRGRDGLMEYYRQGEILYSRDIPARDGSACLVRYSVKENWIEVYLNDCIFPRAFPSFNKVLQMLPIREFLTESQAVLLHSSQVSLPDLDMDARVEESILFTASSGTGKTTQAMLWKEYEHAKLISNDRSLLFHAGENLLSSGFFVDGSQPVYNVQSVRPVAIVCLSQGTDNHIERLRPLKALSLLMSQTVADEWNSAEKSLLQLMWIDILKELPVYRLSCTPDQRAVECLKSRLIADHVMIWRKDHDIN